MSIRQVLLDTETTGLNPKAGDRIIEIGCIELINRRLTGRNFHHYINPERDSEPGALAVHGLTKDFLSDKPKFDAIAQELCEFVRDAEVLIHNAPFDVGFLDAELNRLDFGPFRERCSTIVDTLHLAKQMHPGKRNSLDALCERYGISNSHRTLHGALLDATLLADVYLAMTRGQESLVMDIEPTRQSDAHVVSISEIHLRLHRLNASPEELAEHEAYLDGVAKEIKKLPVWRLPTGQPDQST